MNFGSYSNAKQILEYYAEENEVMPSGWEYIGEGSTRTAFRGPDGVVYKLAHDGDNDWNTIEAEQARRFRHHKELIRLETVIPPTRLWWVGRNNVLAMGYSNGERVQCSSVHDLPCDCRYWGQSRICHTVLCDRLKEIGIQDMFYENVLYSDGAWSIIDLGCESEVS